MKCVRITITMKMEFAAVVTITMNTVTSVGMNTMSAAVKNMSTISTAAVVGKNTITNMVMLNVAVGMSTTTNMVMAKAVAVGNIITAITFRVTRRTAGAKSAIRMKNTATCAAKALKTVPAVCRTLTA